LLQNSYDNTHLTLGMLLQYLGKLKIQISAAVQPIWKKMQAYCILIASIFVSRPQILIFLVLKNGMPFPILIANIIFHVTVLLVIYFCDQFMAPKIRHSRCLCSVCQHSTWFLSDEDNILIKILYLKGYTAKRLAYEFPEKRCTKLGVNKLLKRRGTQTQLTGGQKFKFLISQGSVATRVRGSG